MLHIGRIFDKIAPSAAQGRIAVRSRYRASFESEIGVDGEDKGIQIPIQ